MATRATPPLPPETAAREARARWLDALREAGLGRYVPALTPLLRTAIALEPRDARPSDQRVGASRLGGTPDLPEALPWPADAEGPLPFIAQFDLATLAPFDLEHQLPSQGLLAFFCGWGVDRVRGTVLHLHGVPLVSREAPADVETYALQGVDLAVRVELPPYSSYFVSIDAPKSGQNVVDPHTGAVVPLPPAVVPMPVADHVRYADVYDQARRERFDGQHGLLGYDRVMEGALRPDEVVVLRLDADGTIDQLIGDGVVLYFLIDRAALARGDFSAACAWYGDTI